MMRLHLAKNLGHLFKEMPLRPLATENQFRHITSKYPSIFARNIAVLTEDLKNEAERNGGFKSMDSLPGPRTLPFLGNLEHLKTGFVKMHGIQLNDAKKYGPMHKDQILMTQAVVVQDPDICKEVYNAEAKLPYRDFSILLGEFMKEKRRRKLPKSFVDM